MWFVYTWFGAGAFVSAMNILQWHYEGRGYYQHDKHSPYKWVNQHLTNAFTSFFVGPIVLFIQLVNGMPVIPRREK